MIMKKAMEEVNNEQKEIYVCFIKLAIFIKITYLRTFARKFSNIDFFLKILPLIGDELVMSEM